MRHLVLVAVVVGGLLFTAMPTQAGPIRDAALSRAAALQAEDPSMVRSEGRFVGGAVMLAAGGGMAAYYAVSTCSTDRVLGELFDVRSCQEAATMMIVGAVVAVNGALLMTKWSRVPASSMSVSMTPGGVQVGKTFGW